MKRSILGRACLLAATITGLSLTAWAPAATADTVPGLSTVGATAATTYQTNGVVWAIATSGNVVYTAGTFTSVRPAGAAAGASSEVARSNFAAFNATTGALLPCAPAITLSGSTPTVRALTVSGDGSTLYLGGFFGSVGGQGHSNLAALDTASCTVKANFSPVVDATVRAIATNAGSAVYFGGDFHTVNGATRNLVAAVDATGAVTAFDPNAAPPTDDTRFTSMRALTVSADNTRVVLGGDFDYLAGNPVHRLAIVDATSGAVLNTFPGFIDATSAVKALTHDANNFYLGAEGTGGGVYDGRAAFNINTGANIWRDNCLGATQTVLVSNGVLYSGSHAHNCTNTPGGYPDGARHHLLAQSATDSTILPWYPNTNDGINEMVGPRALTMTADGALWVAGEFTTVNGVNQQGITRFPVKPDNNLPAAPVPTVTSTGPGLVQVHVRTTTDLDQGILTYRIYRDSTLISTQSADSMFANRPQLTYNDTVAPGSFHTYRTDVSDGTRTSALGGTVGITAATTTANYVSRILADQPSTFWRLDDPTGTFAADQAGNNSGTYPATGVTNRVAGDGQDGDTAAALTGTDTIQANNRVAAPTTYTTEMWFKTTTTTGGILIGFGDGSRNNGGTGSNGSYDRHVYMTNSGQLIFGNYAGYTATVTSAKSYNDGAWHYMAATLSSAGTHLYVDGAQVAASANTGAQTYLGYWKVGGGNLGGWPSAPGTVNFTGSVDDVAIYPTALTAAQVYQHYYGVPRPAPTSYSAAVVQSQPSSYWRLDEAAGATTAADASNSGNTGTYASGVSYGQPGALTSDSDTAIAFTGAGAGVVSSAGVSNPTTFSTEFWFKSNTTTGGEIVSFGSNQTIASGSYDRNLYLGNDGKLNFGQYNNGTQVITSPSAYNDGAWHYVVGTLGAGGSKLYVDGSLVASSANTGAQGYNGYWKVGGDNLNGWPNKPATVNFTGSVDEVAIYSTELSASDVSAHYALANQAATPKAVTK